MRKLLNTLYVLQDNAYVSLDGENVVILVDNEEKFRVPLCNIENIVCFNYIGCSPAVMGKCADNGIALNFIRPSGKFLARVTGAIKGSVHLRREQYESLRNPEICVSLAQNVLAAKIHNTRYVLSGIQRNHADNIDLQRVQAVMARLSKNIEAIYNTTSLDTIRGIEGESAQLYFGVFNELIIKNKNDFCFNGRSKRPPLDRVNAMLSYLYTILSLDMQSALETVGLDSYIGFFHTDRAGRASLALDMIEELRAYVVDKLVLNMINLQQIKADDFLIKEGGSVIMTDECRKKLLQQWQQKKTQIIKHHVINEKIPIGLLPYVQAKLMARYLRHEDDEYNPFVCN